MGYNTTFRLETLHRNLNKEEWDELEKIVENTELVFELQSAGYYTTSAWEDWDVDLTKLSTKFPDVVFLVLGNGEDYNDIWRAYFNNGGIQFEKAKITFDDFDKSKLEYY